MRYLIPFVLILAACGDCPDPDPAPAPSTCETLIPVDMITHLERVPVECDVIYPGVCVVDGMTYACEGSGLQ